MSKINPAIGKMACICCGEELTVKRADTGTISVSCPDCDLSGYAKAGTEAHRILMAKIKLKTPAASSPAEPAPARAPAAAPAKPKPAPAPAPRSTIFG